MRLPGVSPEEVKQLAAEAEGMLLAYTGRMTLPGALETAMLQLAVVLHNRRGIEGQTAHSEGELGSGAKILEKIDLDTIGREDVC